MIPLRKYVSVLLISVFCWYYCGINFCSHVHIVNGVSLVHSHPGASKEHSHSEEQFSLIDIITNLLTDCPESSCGIEGQDGQVMEPVSFYHTVRLSGHIYEPTAQRGPPHLS